MAGATTKSVHVDYFPVLTPPQMLETLELAKGAGYYGTITLAADLATYTLSLTGPGNPRIDATIGQVLVYNGNSLTVLDQDDFLSAYTPE